MQRQDSGISVIIDTNVLIYMYEHKRDIFEFAQNILANARFFVLDSSLKEIEHVYKGKPMKLKLLKAFLDKLEAAHKFEVLEVSPELHGKYRNVDNLLIYFSNKYIIYTNDKILKSKIKKKGNTVLTLRLHNVFLN